MFVHVPLEIVYFHTDPAVALFGPTTLEKVMKRFPPAMSARSAITPFGCPATTDHEVPPLMLTYNVCPAVLFTPANILWVALPVVPLDLSKITKFTLVGVKAATCAHAAP
jgi:hypothetical protein